MRFDLSQFQARVLQDALAEATGAYWQKRADDFERALSRVDDYIGRATPAAILAADERLTATAAACRARASLALDGALSESLIMDDPDIDVLDHVVEDPVR